MKTQRLASGLFIATIAGTLSCGSAEGPQGEPTAQQAAAFISGTDDRIERVQVTDPVSYNLGYGVLSEWLAKLLTDNGNGTTTVSTTPFTTTDDGSALCTDVRFYGQPVGFGLACSSFLVGPDLLATAGHCISEWGWTWDKWKYINGYVRNSDGSVATTFHNSTIYTPVRLVAYGVNALSGSQDDWALVRLDRPVDATPLPVDPAPYQPGNNQFAPLWPSMGEFGYDRGLPLKYDTTNSAAVYWNNYGFLAPLDIFPGCSGGPVFDLQSHVVRGLNAGTFSDDYVLDSSGKCWRPNVLPSGGGVANYTQDTYTNNLAVYLKPSGTRNDSESLISYGAPGIVSPASVGYEYLFTMAADSNVYFKYRAAAGWAWSTWSEVPGTVALAKDGVSVAEGANEMWVFAHGANGQLYYNILNEVAGTFSGWTGVSLPSGNLVAARPASFAINTPWTRPIIVLTAVDAAKNGWTKYITYTSNGNGTFTGSGMSNAWQNNGVGAVMPGAQIPGTPSAFVSYLSANNVPVYQEVTNQTSGSQIATWSTPQTMSASNPMLNVQPFFNTSGMVTFAGRDLNDQFWTLTSGAPAQVTGTGAISNLGAWASAGSAIFEAPIFTGKGVMFSLGPDMHLYDLAVSPAIIRTNAGGPTVGSFLADQGFYDVGTAYNSPNTINTTGVANAAPAAVYQTMRYGVMVYTLPNAESLHTYTARLHFAETQATGTGQRVFTIYNAGYPVLSSFDIFAAAGGAFKPVVRDVLVSANAHGQVQLAFHAGTGQPAISGIEILE